MKKHEYACQWGDNTDRMQKKLAHINRGTPSSHKWEDPSLWVELSHTKGVKLGSLQIDNLSNIDQAKDNI